MIEIIISEQQTIVSEGSGDCVVFEKTFSATNVSLFLDDSSVSSPNGRVVKLHHNNCFSFDCLRHEEGESKTNLPFSNLLTAKNTKFLFLSLGLLLNNSCWRKLSTVSLKKLFLFCFVLFLLINCPFQSEDGRRRKSLFYSLFEKINTTVLNMKAWTLKSSFVAHFNDFE